MCGKYCTYRIHVEPSAVVYVPRTRYGVCPQFSPHSAGPVPAESSPSSAETVPPVNVPTGRFLGHVRVSPRLLLSSVCSYSALRPPHTTAVRGLFCGPGAAWTEPSSEGTCCGRIGLSAVVQTKRVTVMCQLLIQKGTQPPHSQDSPKPTQAVSSRAHIFSTMVGISR